MTRTRRWQIGLLIALAGILLALPVSFFSRAVPDRALGSAFSADGSLLARSTESGTGVFDVRSGKLKQRLPVRHAHVAFSPDARLLVTGDLSTVTVWNCDQGKALFSWPGKNRWAFRVAVSPDGTRVAGADDQSLRVWDLSSGTLLTTIPLVEEQDSLTFSPDGQLVVLAGAAQQKDGQLKHEIKLWTVPQGKLHATLVGPEHCIVKSVAVSPDGKTLSTGLSTASVRLWDLASRAARWEAANVRVDYEALCFSADGQSLAVGGWEEVAVFGIAGPNTRNNFRLPRGSAQALWAGPQPGQFLVATKNQVHAVDVTDGRAELIREGFGLRPGLTFGVVALTAVVWAVLWTVAYRRSRLGLPAEAEGERWSWAAALATAACSVGHWGLLVGLAAGDWGGASPLATFEGLAVLWVMVLCVLIPFTVFSRRQTFSLLTSILCVVAVVAQLLFDLYLSMVAAASV